MKDLAIYGAGGLGREFVVLIEQINSIKKQWNLIGFFDDAIAPGTSIDRYTVLGSMADLNRQTKPLHLMLGIADPMVKMSVVNKIKNERMEYPVFIHPQANAGSSQNRFGRGCVITAGCYLTTNITLGDFTLVNLASTIGHDVITGPFTSIMPGANVSGSVCIGEACLLGTGCKILQGLSIGDRCKIGAGAVVTKNFDSDLTVVGIPARVISKH